MQVSLYAADCKDFLDRIIINVNRIHSVSPYESSWKLTYCTKNVLILQRMKVPALKFKISYRKTNLLAFWDGEYTRDFFDFHSMQSIHKL